MIGSTSLLFLIGAGLFSKAIGFFEYYTFSKGVGGDVAETGDGPGSFRVQGNVWHLTYGELKHRPELTARYLPFTDQTGNPEPGSMTTNGGWQIFNSILGWSKQTSLSLYVIRVPADPVVDNTASLGSILGYVFYWILAMVSLLFMKWREGRMPFFPRKKSVSPDQQSSLNQNEEESQEQPETPSEEGEKDIKGQVAGPPVMNKTG